MSEWGWTMPRGRPLVPVAVFLLPQRLRL
uniref:Uncharacterized protein n=1 Tax=Arundo donax TaxID=35708 RepID=A0A0A8YPJ5_ARUDO